MFEAVVLTCDWRQDGGGGGGGSSSVLGLVQSSFVMRAGGSGISNKSGTSAEVADRDYPVDRPIGGGGGGEWAPGKA